MLPVPCLNPARLSRVEQMTTTPRHRTAPCLSPWMVEMNGRQVSIPFAWNSQAQLPTCNMFSQFGSRTTVACNLKLQATAVRLPNCEKRLEVKRFYHDLPAPLAQRLSVWRAAPKRTDISVHLFVTRLDEVDDFNKSL